MPKPLIPILSGKPWMICPNPTDLGSLQGEIKPGKPFGGQEVVDHHIWRDREGVWRCWACVRHTAVGRIFYGWRADSLEQSPWTPTGVMMRRNHLYGESLADRPDPFHEHSEWLQSPFVVREGDWYYLFYGGESCEPLGNLPLSSICLATSQDGIQFNRRLNKEGFAWLFIGPGEARDPCVIKVGDEWLCYYSGAETGSRAPNKVYVRTSRDLLNWSASREVHWGGSQGALAYQCESPFVLFHEGFYYLLRTKNYAEGLVYVYCSEDPFDFGIDNDKGFLGRIDVAAPEIIVDGGRMYITSVKDLAGGMTLQRLEWGGDRKAR